MSWDNKNLMEQINFNVIINFSFQLICLFTQVTLLLCPTCPNQTSDDWLEIINALLYFPADEVLASLLFPFRAPLLFFFHPLSVHVGTCNYNLSKLLLTIV